jgi:hypothetical protein
MTCGKKNKHNNRNNNYGMSYTIFRENKISGSGQHGGSGN